MYVAVKGGEKAIRNAHLWLEEQRRGDPSITELSVEQIAEQLTLACDRVMAEGSCYDRELAALAIKQSRGDLVEAAFLVRAYRTTLPRLAVSEPVETANMLVRRRISATYKELPGGQVLGPTFDYSHRLLNFKLMAEGAGPVEPAPTRHEGDDFSKTMPRVTDILNDEGLIQTERSMDRDASAGQCQGADQASGEGQALNGEGGSASDVDEEPVADLTREPLLFPAGRDTRLQNLARGDEGFMLALGYSTQRGFGGTHPFVGEIRQGEVAVEIVPEELGFAIDIGDIEVTECQMVNQFQGSKHQPPQFTRGYGLCFGHGERRAMSMALVDRALRTAEMGEEVTAPAQDEEFVLYHSDNIQATGFVEHLKLPHYVDFQGELDNIRALRQKWDLSLAEAAE